MNVLKEGLAGAEFVTNELVLAADLVQDRVQQNDALDMDEDELLAMISAVVHTMRTSTQDPTR